MLFETAAHTFSQLPTLARALGLVATFASPSRPAAPSYACARSQSAAGRVLATTSCRQLWDPPKHEDVFVLVGHVAAFTRLENPVDDALDRPCAALELFVAVFRVAHRWPGPHSSFAVSMKSELKLLSQGILRPKPVHGIGLYPFFCESGCPGSYRWRGNIPKRFLHCTATAA